MFNRTKLVALPAAWLAGCLLAGAAWSQAPSPAPQKPPAPVPGAPSPATPSTAAKPAEKPDEGDMVRIRGQVESADATGARVQLSKGISIRVDIDADTPVFSAVRIALGDLPAGAQVGVRATAAPVAGENGIAADVLALGPSAPSELAGLNVRGAYKALDKSGEKPVLVVTERNADRRFTLTNETTYWRLQPAQLKDLKAGELISVLIVRDRSGHARAQRAVFGSSPGGMLPL